MKFLEKKYNIYELTGFLLMLSYIIVTACYIYYQNIQINILTEQVLSLQNKIIEMLDLVKKNEVQIEELKSIIFEEKNITNAFVENPEILKQKSDLSKFYITTALYVVGAGTIGLGLLCFVKGFSIFGMLKTITPTSVKVLLANQPLGFLKQVKTYEAVDLNLELTWFVEIINDTVCRVSVKPFTNPDVMILASQYFSGRSLPAASIAVDQGVVSVSGAVVPYLMSNAPVIMAGTETFTNIVV